LGNTKRLNGSKEQTPLLNLPLGVISGRDRSRRMKPLKKREGIKTLPIYVKMTYLSHFAHTFLTVIFFNTGSTDYEGVLNPLVRLNNIKINNRDGSKL